MSTRTTDGPAELTRVEEAQADDALRANGSWARLRQPGLAPRQSRSAERPSLLPAATGDHWLGTNTPTLAFVAITTITQHPFRMGGAKRVVLASRG